MTMMSDGKENIRHVTCANHAARSDKDFSRMCPSKQSRRELEDHYFSLLENNTTLKRTINGQREQIKLLTTKVQRMTVQKNVFGNQNKECCASAKTILSEQKESIENLKKANERLSDRIRLLNMRLCSAKQFLKRSPASSAVRCVKCCLTPNASIKNASMCVLNNKDSEMNLRTEASSSQLLNKESTTNTAAEVDSTEMKDEPCQQNKCRTAIDELKQKIVNLEEELVKTHEQYSERICKLEEEMRELRGENYKIKALKAESEHRLEAEEKKSAELLQKLRRTEIQCVNLVTELQIEKSKVLELETEVKSADISSQIAEALEKHLITAMTNRKSSLMRSKTEPSTLDVCISDNTYSPTIVVSQNPEVSRFEHEPKKESIVMKNSDDSGYADKLDDKQEPPSADQNILDQIASLQSQLNNLKLSMKDGDNILEKRKLVKKKSDSGEINGIGDTSFSHSYDLSQASKFKTNEKIDENSSKKTLQQTEKHDPHSKIPLPINAPKMSFQEKIKQSNVSNNSEQNKKNIHSNSNIDKPLQENEVVDKETSDINTEFSNQNKPEVIKRKDYGKKRRRSSVKDFDQNKAKDLTVSNDQNKIVLDSPVNVIDSNKETQEKCIGQIKSGTCQDDAENKVSEKNLKNKIYSKTENSENTGVNLESDFNVINSEADSCLKREEIKKVINEIPSFEQEKKSNKKNGIQTINKASDGTSSGNSTYTVNGKATHNNSNREETYDVGNKNNQAPPSVQDGKHQNCLDAKEIAVAQNQYRMSVPVNTSTPKRQKIKKVEESADLTSSTSSDNTDHEISSMTDLPNEDKSPRDYISPGEERPTSTFSESYAATTTTDYGSLSLGEVPVAGVKRLSDFERERSDSIGILTTPNKMGEALRAINDELTRCRVLLQGQLPAQVIPDLLSGYRSVRN